MRKSQLFKTNKYRWIYNCLKVIAIPSRDPTKPMKTIKLPVYIEYLPQDQYVSVRPSKFLYFNRVAKTGSTSFINMFLKLGESLGYCVFAGIIWYFILLKWLFILRHFILGHFSFDPKWNFKIRLEETELPWFQHYLPCLL